MGDKQTFLADKPYGFVPLTEVVQKARSAPHNTYEKSIYSGKLRVSFVTKSKLHIGDGRTDVNRNGDLLKKMTRRNGQLVIPGSSVKGVVRSIAEAVSYSCGIKLPNPRLTEMKKALPKKNQDSCQTVDSLCPTCSLFGMTSGSSGYRSKVNFGEFICKENPAHLIEVEIPLQETPFKDYPRNHDVFRNAFGFGNERLYYCRACDGRESGACETCQKADYYEAIRGSGANRPMRFRGRKFYRIHAKGYEASDGIPVKKALYEMAEEGSTFTGEIVFQGLTAKELSLLVFSLGLDETFFLAFGYGKPLGYGCVSSRLETVEDMMSRYSSTSVMTAETIEEMTEKYCKEADKDICLLIDELRRIRGE